MKSRWFTILMVTILLISLLSCSKQPSKLDKIVVTLDWTPNTNHTGLYVAKEKGFFAKQGLDVEIIQPGEGISEQIVASQKAQFGVSYQENVTRARANNIPVVSLAAIIQHNTSAFAFKPDSGITTAKDFEGKRYGGWGTPSEEEVIKAVMAKQHADFSKVKVVSGVTELFSTIGRDADFEWIYLGWDGVAAKIKNFPIQTLRLKDLDPALDYYTPILITNDTMIKNNPKIVRRFMKAVSEGYRFAITNPDAAAEIMVKAVPELDPTLVRESQKWLSKEYQAEAPRWGEQKAEVWERYYQWMLERKLLPKAINIQQAYTNEFLPE